MVTLEPHDGYVNSSWLSLNVKKTTKSLTHFRVKIYCFNGKMSEGEGFSTTVFNSQLLGLTLSLVMRLDELVIMLNLEVLQTCLSLFQFLDEPEILVLVTSVCL